MRIHEYQAKEIFSQSGVPILRGGVASTPDEARAIAQELGGKVVVKAQVHAGGRGKGGGIKVVSSPEEAAQAASSLIGGSLVTPQTGPEGVPVRRVLVEEAMDIGKELYLAVVVDADSRGVAVMASEAGGMEIEEVAASAPEKIIRMKVDPAIGFQPFQGRALAYGMNLKPELARPISDIASNLCRVFEAKDCSLVEINPLVLTDDGRLLALDAKITFDDDAMFRHPDLKELADPEQEDPIEVRAAEYDIKYVKLDGDVGCMVNGAGLAMATMDVTRMAEANPANFLDIGGAADEEKVAKGIGIILSDPKVTRVLVNVFGGILACDTVARGLLQALKQAGYPKVPVVARLLGTNAEEARRILSESGLNVTLVNDLQGAAEAIKAAV